MLTVIEHWGWAWQIFSLLTDSYRYTTPCINSTVRTILINWNPNKLVRWRAKVSEQRQPVQFCVSGDQHSFSLEKRLGSLGIGTKLVSPLTHFTVLYMTCPSRTVVIFHIVLLCSYVQNFQTFDETMSWSIGVLKYPVPISRTSPEVDRAAADRTLVTKCLDHKIRVGQSRISQSFFAPKCILLCFAWLVL